MKLKQKLPLLIISIALLFASGCESFSDKQNAAELRWQKTSAGIKLEVAKEQFSNGRYDDAEKTVSECLANDDELAEAYILAGKLALVKGSFDQAFEHLSKAVELDSSLDDGWYWLGAAAIEESKFQKATECFQKAADIDRKNIEYIKSLGQCLIIQGQYRDALKLYQKKAKQFSGEPSLKVAMAGLSMKLGDYDSAVKYYKQAILFSNENTDAIEALGYCYIISQRWEDAAQSFDTLSNSPDIDQQYKHRYLKILAICNMNAGNYGIAASNYDQISDVERENPEFWLKLGHALLGSGSTNSALACSKRAIALRPGWPEALALQGSTEYISKDYRTAIRIFKGISADKNNAAFAWLMIGRCYNKLGNFRQAKQAYQQSLEIRPDNAYARKLISKL